MCLIATTTEPLIATEDIKVYKDISRISKYFIKTPFRGVLLTEYSSKINKQADVLTIKGSKINKITDQGVHAYLNKTLYFGIVTGIIPKGTKYWVDCNFPEIAAEHIKFNVPFRVRFFMFFYDMTKRIRYKFRNML